MTLLQRILRAIIQAILSGAFFSALYLDDTMHGVTAAAGGLFAFSVAYVFGCVVCDPT